ncbi:MAG: hypothetical protein HFE77_04985 [Clostridiales bacterium]|nr:hypothetical protein [Clostridiales bacterium]
MRNILCFTLLCALFLTLMCGCSDKNKQPENTEPDATATEPATEPSTETPTEPPTEPMTEAPTEPEGLQLNMDLLNDIGLTYDQLTEKYGEVNGFGRPHGGFGYRFENGYGNYIFNANDVLKEGSNTYFRKNYINDLSTLICESHPHDEQGDYIPLPKENSQCHHIEYIKSKNLFINAPDSISIYDIQNIEGITYYITEEDELYGDYYTAFDYQGLEIVLNHSNSEMIHLNTYKDTDEIWSHENGSAIVRKSLRT